MLAKHVRLFGFECIYLMMQVAFCASNTTVRFLMVELSRVAEVVVAAEKCLSLFKNVRSLSATSAQGDFIRVNQKVMGENYYKKRSSSLFGRVIASGINI